MAEADAVMHALARACWRGHGRAALVALFHHSMIRVALNYFGR